MATKRTEATDAEVKRQKRLEQYQRNQAERRAAAAAQAEADMAELVNVEFNKVSPKRKRTPTVKEPATAPVAAETQPDAQPTTKRRRTANEAVTS